MSPRTRAVMVVLALTVLVVAAGACLAEATGHHGDATAAYCAAAIAVRVIPALTLVGAGWLAPVAGTLLPALALDLAAPPPRA